MMTMVLILYDNIDDNTNSDSAELIMNDNDKMIMTSITWIIEYLVILITNNYCSTNKLSLNNI